MPRSPDGSRTPDGLSLVLAQAVVGAVDAVGGYAGGVYLRSRTPGLLLMAVLAGLPGPLLRPWWRMHVNRPFPVAEAYRTGRPVYLGDADEAMRRFPQLMAGLPFPFGSLYAPFSIGTTPVGVLVVLRYATRGVPVGGDDRRRMETYAAGLGADLTALDVPARWDDPPLLVRLPAGNARPLRVGHFEWDFGSGAVTADDDARQLLGNAPADPPARTMEALTARLLPEDVHGLWTLGSGAAESAEPHVGRMRLWCPDGRPLLVELSGHGAGDSTPGRLTGVLLDPGACQVVPDAADRIPRGMLCHDRLGRITYVNGPAEEILGHDRAELIGGDLRAVLPWLANPAYEDHHRAALFSDDPVHFLARRTPRQWLSVSMFPGQDGVTITFGPSGSPDRPPKSSGRAVPGAGLGLPADRSAVLYRPVALAIALTEAVTARQVSAVVTEELLPAFGGRQLAIYLQHERRLYLASETGFPQGFLDGFDGVGLDAHIPGVETLTSGRPMFFESMEQLAAAYPGIPMDASVGARAFLPLIASGRPVGSCILGFDQPRGFNPEERAVLTALAGLIAQALQRAQRYDTEAALARGLQDALLPHRLPVVDRVETVGRYLSGTQDIEVGGDWYDVIETGDGLALVIGDVQGHGVAAAATMGQLRSAVRAFALTGHDPQETMSATNQLLIGLDPGQFASCCYVLLDPGTGLARAVRAGHPQPVVRHADGRTEVLGLSGGVVLGVDPGASYPVTELRLDDGSVLAMFTDGLVEKAGTDIDEGIERLRGILADVGHLPLAETADLVIAQARQDDDRPDDIALLMAARRARPAETGP